MSSFQSALLGVPLAAAVACMDTSSLTGGEGTVNGNLLVNGPVCSQQTISLSGLGP